MFEQREQFQCQERKRGDRNGNIEGSEPNGNPDRPGGPNARRRRSAMNRAAVLENSAAADKPYPGDDALDDASRSLGRIYEKRFGRLDKAAGRHGDERKRTQASAARFLLPIPSDRECQCIGAGEREDVRDNLKVVQVHVLSRVADDDRAARSFASKPVPHASDSAPPLARPRGFAIGVGLSIASHLASLHDIFAALRFTLSSDAPVCHRQPHRRGSNPGRFVAPG